jgi:predicted kinase
VLRQIVLVSGAPGSGKTSLAIPLAAELEFPLLTKDDIKETLWDSLKPAPGDFVWSRKLGASAMEVMWTLAARCPRVVLEAPFRPNQAFERDHFASLDARFVEVHCWCSPGVAIRRYGERAEHRHPAHVIRELTPEHLAEFDGTLRMGPVIEVNTEEAVNITCVARRVRELLARHEGTSSS